MSRSFEDSGGRSPLIIKDLDLYPQPPLNTRSPTLNSEEPDYREPALFTSDVRPHESSSYFTARDGKIKSLKIPVTDIAPEEARGDSLEDALVIYRHFCDILKSRYGKPKRRKNRNGFYEALYISPQGVGINPGGCRSFVECYIKSPEEMFIESEYARLVAKGYISEDE